MQILFTFGGHYMLMVSPLALMRMAFAASTWCMAMSSRLQAWSISEWQLLCLKDLQLLFKG